VWKRALRRAASLLAKMEKTNGLASHRRSLSLGLRVIVVTFHAHMSPAFTFEAFR
jgi:hypothetical protein